MLRATTACTFSTSQLPKVVREWCVLYILTWKCASRHNGVHFFISHLASWVRTRRFSEPTFRPSGATNHWKNTVNRDFPTFSRICIFFLLIFSLLTLLTSAFQLSILSEVSLLNFLRWVIFHGHVSHNQMVNIGKDHLPPARHSGWRIPALHPSEMAVMFQAPGRQWGSILVARVSVLRICAIGCGVEIEICSTYESPGIDRLE